MRKNYTKPDLSRARGGSAAMMALSMARQEMSTGRDGSSGKGFTPPHRSNLRELKLVRGKAAENANLSGIVYRKTDPARSAKARRIELLEKRTLQIGDTSSGLSPDEKDAILRAKGINPESWGWEADMQAPQFRPPARPVEPRMDPYNMAAKFGGSPEGWALVG